MHVFVKAVCAFLLQHNKEHFLGKPHVKECAFLMIADLLGNSRTTAVSQAADFVNNAYTYRHS